MEPDDERCLDLMRPTKDMATEIHPHYNEVFQRLDCSLSEDIWCATSRRNKMRPAKPWKDSEHFILGDRKCKSLASAENYKIRVVPLRYHFFRQWIAAMEPDDDRFLEQCKDIGNNIHPHYNHVFQQLDCFLSEDIWRSTRVFENFE